MVAIEPADHPADMQNPTLGGIPTFSGTGKARAYELGGGNYNARPVGWRFRRRTRYRLRQRGAKPGVHLTDLATVLPDYAVSAMRGAARF